jgi:hypothetical protein
MDMKAFIIKSGIFLAVVSSIFLAVLSRADGYTDAFYIRFTTPPQNHLILGTSRSAQALQPSQFREVLGKEIFNYSFTLSHSPFGPVYLNSIKKKLNNEVKDGIFIISVDPWSISNIGPEPDDTTLFVENDLMLANLCFVNVNPNLEYLIKNCGGKYYSMLRKQKGNMFLHHDGWLEVSVPMEHSIVEKRQKEKLDEYKKTNLPHRELSYARLNYLKKTINFLKDHGHVYLVRLPVSAAMFEIENQFLPQFNEIISEAAVASDGYLDMTNENDAYLYIDGNHMWKESGKQASRKVAEWIKQRQH